MTQTEKAVISTLIYYDLLDKPLTSLETYKYLFAAGERLSFSDFKRLLAQSTGIPKIIGAENGLYFLNGRTDLLDQREDRLKSSQLKWKRLKKIAGILSLAPFVRLIAVTGSMTAHNTRPESDFDLLIVSAKNRLWITRLAITAIAALIGQRRHGNLTRDRVCLNCYLDEERLEIKPEFKPHDLHSAQEYGRLTPLLEIESGLYQKFVSANSWLAQFLEIYPWPNFVNDKEISSPKIFSALRRLGEWLLNGRLGDWAEKRLGQWQTRRILKKTEYKPYDQVFVDSRCLMFHPQSKSYGLMNEFDRRFSKYELN